MVPIELYKFADANTIWYYTSADRDIEYDGHTYLSTTIGRGEIESKASVQRENIEVTFAVDNPMARGFLQYIPDTVVTLVIFIQSDAGTFVGWKGRLGAVKPEKSAIKLVCESIYVSLKRTGLRAQYQRQCRHMLYSPGCGVVKSAYAVTATAISCEGYRLVLSAAPGSEPVGFYTGGVLDFNGAMRGIINHDTSNGMDLADIFPALRAAIADNPGGVSVTLYPGCDRSKDTCRTRFMNFENYGGFPEIPLRNPMDGRSIT